MANATTNTSNTSVRRDDVVAAATALMAERGSRGTSIAAVAERAGMTDAGVLYHFKTKKALLLAVLERFDAAAEQLLVQPEQRAIELLRSTRDWGEHMEHVPDIQSLLIMLTAEHLHTEGEARDYIRGRYQRLLRRYRTAFAQAAADGDLRGDLDPDFEASALLAHLDGIRFQWFLTDEEVSMAASVRTYVDATLDRLSPERAR